MEDETDELEIASHLLAGQIRRVERALHEHPTYELQSPVVVSFSTTLGWAVTCSVRRKARTLGELGKAVSAQGAGAREAVDALLAKLPRS